MNKHSFCDLSHSYAAWQEDPESFLPVPMAAFICEVE